ncbi:MAG: DUF692 domain-containing protein [Alphaproteobacteria bacterium]|nr:DUF692 domain-containing protein [Alphaproteobacteria bacterium]
MPDASTIRPGLPASAGVGLKPVHYDVILSERPDVGWFEVHAENYMGDGGPPHRYLEKIRSDYPLSLHGVGLSLGGAEPPDADHLRRLRHLADRYEPGLISEHLAWSRHDGAFLNDLLPISNTGENLNRLCDHVDRLQSVLNRWVAIENPSTYVAFADQEMDEVEFLSALSARTGCALLLDVNNVHVSAVNHGWDANAYIADFPMDRVAEIHLAGHAQDCDDAGADLLIDAHDRAVSDPVWALYRDALRRSGPVPTLIEWDNDVPDWPTLHAEALRAQSILDGDATAAKGAHAHAG